MRIKEPYYHKISALGGITDLPDGVNLTDAVNLGQVEDLIIGDGSGFVKLDPTTPQTGNININGNITNSDGTGTGVATSGGYVNMFTPSGGGAISALGYFTNHTSGNITLNPNAINIENGDNKVELNPSSIKLTNGVFINTLAQSTTEGEFVNRFPGKDGTLATLDDINDITYSNGLTKTGTSVKLGGTFIDTTTVIGDVDVLSGSVDGVVTLYNNGANPAILFGSSYMTNSSRMLSQSNNDGAIWYATANQGDDFLLLSLNTVEGGIVQDTIFEKGLGDFTDYSANKTDYSYVTKKWVTDNFSGGSGVYIQASPSSPQSASISVTGNVTAPNFIGNASLWGEQAFQGGLTTTPSIMMGFNDVQGKWTNVYASDVLNFLGSPSGGETLGSVVARGNATTEQIGVRSLFVQGATGVNNGNADFILKTANGNGFWDIASDQIGNGTFLLYDALSNKSPFRVEVGASDQALVINSNGNILINTGTENGTDEKLQITGNMSASVVTANSYFQSGSGYFAEGNTVGVSGNGASGLSFRSNTTDGRMILNASGNLLINTLTDNGSGAKLQVTGNATFETSVGRVNIANDSGTSNHPIIYQSGSTGIALGLTNFTDEDAIDIIEGAITIHTAQLGIEGNTYVRDSLLVGSGIDNGSGAVLQVTGVASSDTAFAAIQDISGNYTSISHQNLQFKKGTYTTTIEASTPTADRGISIQDAGGTMALTQQAIDYEVTDSSRGLILKDTVLGTRHRIQLTSGVVTVSAAL